MDKRFWISGAVMSVATLLFGFLVHGTLLAGEYKSLGALYRPEAEQLNYFPYMIFAHVLMGFAMTWIYRQGVDSGKGVLGQGLRFGLALALFSAIPWYLIYYTIQPIPAALAHKQMIFDTLGLLVMGVLVAYLNPRPRAS